MPPRQLGKSQSKLPKERPAKERGPKEAVAWQHHSQGPHCRGETQTSLEEELKAGAISLGTQEGSKLAAEVLCHCSRT